ncbi:MAG: winged helix-turn-helix domain-containing protein, partial [Actinobacteria bacterium]|nr:winged helix-turn-helix domain-containing protein [Actinomycetota bacterium]
MSAKPVQLSPQQARRIALGAQGFGQPRPSGRVDRRHLRKVLDHIGLIQIDSVNVLVRSQELPLFARLGPHDRSLIPSATKARVIPVQHLKAPTPTEHDAHRELLEMAARSVGLGTVRDIADYFRIKPTIAKPRIDELVEAGRLIPASMHGSAQRLFVHADARTPRSIDARALLSMFDPVVWFRPRAEWLFDFHYRIEIYTPAPQRKYGYYVLPFLLGDRLVARVDVKADRANETLLVPGAFAEQHADPKVVAPALADELGQMANWLGLENIRVGT